MIKVTTSNVQDAMFEIRKALREFAPDKFVTVGIHEDSGAHPGDDGDLTNAQLGAILHFGTDDARIPPRPWLDVGVQSGNQDYIDAIKAGVESDQSLNDTLNVVGVIAEAKVKQFMVDLRTPPNAPSTIARKGSSNPLVDTGSLVGSVTYKIQDGTLPNEGLE